MIGKINDRIIAIGELFQPHKLPSMDDGQTDQKFNLSRDLKKISPDHIIYQDHVDPTWELHQLRSASYNPCRNIPQRHHYHVIYMINA